MPYLIALQPLVLTQAGQMTLQLIDNVMLGHFGTAELAAASFANNIYIVIMLLGLGVLMGLTPLVGHARGEQKETQAAATMKNGFVLTLLLIPGIILISWAIIWIMPRKAKRLKLLYYFLNNRNALVSLVGNRNNCNSGIAIIGCLCLKTSFYETNVFGAHPVLLSKDIEGMNYAKVENIIAGKIMQGIVLCRQLSIGIVISLQ